MARELRRHCAARVVVGLSLALTGCAASHDEARSGGETQGASSGQLDQSAIDVAMERVRPIVSACVAGGRRNETWNVRVTIGPDGHPSDVRVDNEQPDPQMSACLEGADGRHGHSVVRFFAASGPRCGLTMQKR